MLKLVIVLFGGNLRQIHTYLPDREIMLNNALKTFRQAFAHPWIFCFVCILLILAL